MKNFIANTISLIPIFLAFTASMLAMGSYQMDILSIGFLMAAVMVFKPCQHMADILWKG